MGTAVFVRTEFTSGNVQGMIDDVEQALIDWFVNDPRAAYISAECDSFARLLHHAVAQYLLLKTSSEYCFVTIHLKKANRRLR